MYHGRCGAPGILIRGEGRMGLQNEARQFLITVSWAAITLVCTFTAVRKEVVTDLLRMFFWRSCAITYFVIASPPAKCTAINSRSDPTSIDYKHELKRRE